MEGDRGVTCRCCLIPSIKECLTAVRSVMTVCLRLPAKADRWECHSRRTAPGDASPQLGKHAHTFSSYVDAQVYPFISAIPDREDGIWRNLWMGEVAWQHSCSLGEQWSNWQGESMQRVDGQTLSPQADKHSRQPSQCSTDRKPLHKLPSINSSLPGH